MKSISGTKATSIRAYTRPFSIEGIFLRFFFSWATNARALLSWIIILPIVTVIISLNCNLFRKSLGYEGILWCVAGCCTCSS